MIVNNEKYKKQLIFTNGKKQKNSEVYRSILMEINEKYSEHDLPTFVFDIKQMRTKFKWCVSTCKRMSMTICHATGIKRIQDKKGFEKWFDLLYPLIKLFDSFQPDNTSGTGESLFLTIKSAGAGKKIRRQKFY